MERHSYISTPHTSTANADPVHWKDPGTFNPQRYLGVPTSAQITEDKCQQIGLAQCPFEITNFQVKDGRKGGKNVYEQRLLELFSVLSMARAFRFVTMPEFAPFGFGYRRCPGEQLTIQVFEDFLRKVWRDKTWVQCFRKLI